MVFSIGAFSKIQEQENDVFLNPFPLCFSYLQFSFNTAIRENDK